MRDAPTLGNPLEVEGSSPVLATHVAGLECKPKRGRSWSDGERPFYIPPSTLSGVRGYMSWDNADTLQGTMKTAIAPS